MRKLIVMSTLAVVGLGFMASATALWWPPKVVIGYGGGGGTTTNAMVVEGCVIADEIVCPCVPGLPVLQSCLHSAVPIGCLTADMVYEHVDQSVPVLEVNDPQVLGTLVCTGLDDTAYVVLPTQGVQQPPQPPKK